MMFRFAIDHNKNEIKVKKNYREKRRADEEYEEVD